MADAAAETWADIVPLAPLELRPYLLDFEWSLERLWALELPVEVLPVSDLAWLLDLRLWRFCGRPFTVTPRQVARDPWRFRQQYSRMLAADLRYPLDVTWRENRWMILDGVHRLLKAFVLGRDEVDVRKVPQPLLASLAGRPGAASDRSAFTRERQESALSSLADGRPTQP